MQVFRARKVISTNGLTRYDYPRQPSTDPRILRRNAQLVVGKEIVKHLAPVIGLDLRNAQFRGPNYRLYTGLVRIMRSLGLSTTVIGTCLNRDHSNIVKLLGGGKNGNHRSA